jgi:hypothetical protein
MTEDHESDDGGPMIASKDDLLRQRFGVTDYHIPGVGTVRVRPLTRGEALQVVGVERDKRELEAQIVAWAMVEPKLTEAEVRTWMDNSAAGELQALTQFITKLSGLGEGAPKSGLPGVRG